MDITSETKPFSVAKFDDRGYVYVADRAQTGLHILEPTGEARRIADFPR